jgi:hypothetical protein
MNVPNTISNHHSLPRGGRARTHQTAGSNTAEATKNLKETLRNGGMCVTVTRIAAQVLPHSTLSSSKPTSSRLPLIMCLSFAVSSPAKAFAPSTQGIQSFPYAKASYRQTPKFPQIRRVPSFINNYI